MAKENKNQSLPSNASVGANGYSKFNIAKTVLVYGLIAVSILGLVAIYFAFRIGDASVAFANTKDILSMILPLIGAWVGTVLAYYFSRDNYLAATESTREMFKEFSSSAEKLKKTLVKEKMIPVQNMRKLILDESEKDIDIRKDIFDNILNMEPRVNRLPILHKNQHPAYVIHRSNFDSFFIKMVLLKTDINNLSLADLTQHDTFKASLQRSFETIGEHASLSDAKELMDRNEFCQDILVTEDGNRNSKVIGWITNVEIAAASIV